MLMKTNKKISSRFHLFVPAGYDGKKEDKEDIPKSHFNKTFFYLCFLSYALFSSPLFLLNFCFKLTFPSA